MAKGKTKKLIRKRASAYRKRPAPKRLGRPNLMEEEWDSLKSEVSQGLQNARSAGEMQPQTPFEKPEAFLKRTVYKFVCDCLDSKQGNALHCAIEQDCWPRSPGTISFDANPFHWALFGLRDPQAEILARSQVARFGRQMLYARRHGIPAELLIGFIFQTGDPARVYRDAGKAEVFEKWHPSYRETKTEPNSAGS